MDFRIWTILFFAILCLGGCASKRSVNYYKTNLQGTMLFAEGNDTALVSSLKVTVAEVREEAEGRIHVVLFENVGDEGVSVEYRYRWLNHLQVATVDFSSWKGLRLAERSQKLELVRQPDVPDLVALEIAVRPSEND